MKIAHFKPKALEKANLKLSKDLKEIYKNKPLWWRIKKLFKGNKN